MLNAFSWNLQLYRFRIQQLLPIYKLKNIGVMMYYYLLHTIDDFGNKINK